MTENIGVNQRVVVNPDGRQSVISVKLANDHRFMVKHGLQLLEKYEGNPVIKNVPTKSNKEKESELMAQLGITAKDIGMKQPDNEPTGEVELDLDLAPAPDPKPVKKGGK